MRAFILGLLVLCLLAFGGYWYIVKHNQNGVQEIKEFIAPYMAADKDGASAKKYNRGDAQNEAFVFNDALSSKLYNVQDSSSSSAGSVAAPGALAVNTEVLLDGASTPDYITVSKKKLSARALSDNAKLIAAVTTGKLEEVQKTLSGGAKPANVKSGEESSVFAAIEANEPAIVRLLLEKGAPVNQKNKAGQSPVNVTAQKRFKNKEDTAKSDTILGILLDFKADINAKDKDGMTPLMLACVNGRADGLKLLLSRGADKEAYDNRARTALDIAKEMKLRNCQNLLKK